MSSDYVRKTLVYFWARDMHASLPFPLPHNSDLPSLLTIVAVVVLNKKTRAGEGDGSFPSTLQFQCESVLASYVQYVSLLRNKALWIRNQLRSGSRNDFVQTLNSYSFLLLLSPACLTTVCLLV